RAVRRVGDVAELAQLARAWIEREVRSRRCKRVGTIPLNILEAIVAVCVGDRFTNLRAGHSHNRAGNAAAVRASGYPTAHLANGLSVERHAKHAARAAGQII